MNTLSYLSLISELLNAFEVLFPKATNLAKAASVGNVMTAAVAPALADQTLDPSVAQLHAVLPVIVTEIQTVKTIVNSPAVPAA